MISKKYINEMKMSSIDDVFKYIIDSENVGAISQFRELIKKLSDSQFNDFNSFVDDVPDFKNKVLMARIE